MRTWPSGVLVMAEVLPTSVNAEPFVFVRSDENWLNARCESSSLPIVNGARGSSSSILSVARRSVAIRSHKRVREGTHSPTV